MVIKGSVNTVTQKENNTSIKFPLSGEIGLMPYYKNWMPFFERSRIIAAENDVVGLLWLTKIHVL